MSPQIGRLILANHISDCIEPSSATGRNQPLPNAGCQDDVGIRPVPIAYGNPQPFTNLIQRRNGRRSRTTLVTYGMSLMAMGDREQSHMRIVPIIAPGWWLSKPAAGVRVAHTKNPPSRSKHRFHCRVPSPQTRPFHGATARAGRERLSRTSSLR